MASCIGRRKFLATLGGAAAAWPARAQQAAMPVIGFLGAGAREPLRQQIAAFFEGLKESGYVEGQNVTVKYRFAEGRFDQFPALASDLVRSGVAVLFVASNAGALAARQATTTVPIIFSVGEDPIASGLVPSLSRPGGNLTGVYQLTNGLEAKRLGLLHEMAPKATIIGLLVNPTYSGAEDQLHEVQEAVASLGVQLVIVRANVESDFDVAFSTLIQQRATALLVGASPFFNIRRQQLVVLAARYSLPAIYEWRDFAAAGGLMSYGTSLADAYREAGVYAGRILKGAKPADLPVVQSTKFEFVINLPTARALGIEIPPTLLARADEAIE